MTVSPMCDRDTQDMPSMIWGTITLLAMPLYDEVFKLVKKTNPGPAEAKIAAICAILINNHTQ